MPKIRIFPKILIITGLIVLIQTAALCSDPLCNIPLTGQCNNGYCQCNTNLIFNCTTSATTLSAGTSVQNIVNNQNLYLVLNSSLDENIEYLIVLNDSSNGNFLDIYDVGAYIDQGVGTAYSYPNGYAWTSSGSVQIQLQTKLTYVSGTTIPQQLILNVTHTAPGSSTFTVDYSYSNSSYSGILLILGYVAGGVLILATIIIVVIVWRRSRQDES